MSIYKYEAEVLTDWHLSLDSEAITKMDFKKGEKIKVVLLKGKTDWHKKLKIIRDEIEKKGGLYNGLTEKDILKKMRDTRKEVWDESGVESSCGLK